MSTDVYGVRVLELDGLRVRFQVFLVYYDWDDVPGASPTFFVRILNEQIDVIPTEEICNDQWVLQNAGRYIRHVALVSHSKPVAERDTFYYERDGGWKDEDILVQGIFDVFVRDASYIEGLRVGMAWGTTSYESNEDSCVVSAQDGPPVDFRGKTVVLTGRMAVPHEEATRILKERGARVTSSVSSRSDYVIVGATGGRKYRDAHRYRIPLLDQDYLTTTESDWDAVMRSRGTEPAPLVPVVLLFRLPEVPIGSELAELTGLGDRLDRFTFFITHNAHRYNLFDRVSETDGLLSDTDIRAGMQIAQWCVWSSSSLIQPLWRVKRSGGEEPVGYRAGFHVGGTLDDVRQSFITDGFEIIEGAEAFVRDGGAEASEMMATQLLKLLTKEAPALADTFERILTR